MKITFNLDSGANIHSCKTVSFDLSKEKDEKRLGYTLEEWSELTQEEKDDACNEWAQDHVQIYWTEE